MRVCVCVCVCVCVLSSKNIFVTTPPSETYKHTRTHPYPHMQTILCHESPVHLQPQPQPQPQTQTQEQTDTDTATNRYRHRHRHRQTQIYTLGFKTIAKVAVKQRMTEHVTFPFLATSVSAFSNVEKKIALTRQCMTTTGHMQRHHDESQQQFRGNIPYIGCTIRVFVRGCMYVLYIL